MPDGPRTMWVDVSAGVAGDMLLAALLDAGAGLAAVQEAVDAVVPASVVLSPGTVTRAGLRATGLTVSVLPTDTPRRSWRDIRELLDRAALPEAVRRDARSVFERLAGAEARVHGTDVEDVHFHEVGALDSIADVVGSCAAIHDLRVESITAGPMALGAGQVIGAHGTMPVPAPAVLQLVGGWTVSAGGSGELATPTGAALVTALAHACAPLPAMRVEAVGVGAGTREVAGRANVVRVVIGRPAPQAAPTSDEVLLEANVDDLDPRVWPSVLAALLDAGAGDAWLTPILMKKGRPAHTLHVLAAAALGGDLQRMMLSRTSTIGVRRIQVAKYALSRTWFPVPVRDGTVRIKLAHDGGVIAQVSVEFDDAQALAARLGLPVQDVLRAAESAAAAAGLVRGRRLPAGSS